MTTAPRLGRRIVIYGATGSGKTTLARELGASLGLGVIELDAIRHDRGWDSTPWDEFEARIVEALASHTEGWVCDGNYSRVAATVLAEADTLIWLRLPWRVSFWRLLRRTLWRARSGEPLYNADGPRETWRGTFLSKSSILWWSIHHHRALQRGVRRRIDRFDTSVRVIELRSAREVEGLLREVGVRA